MLDARRLDTDEFQPTAALSLLAQWLATKTHSRNVLSPHTFHLRRIHLCSKWSHLGNLDSINNSLGIESRGGERQESPENQNNLPLVSVQKGSCSSQHAVCLHKGASILFYVKEAKKFTAAMHLQPGVHHNNLTADIFPLASTQILAEMLV